MTSNYRLLFTLPATKTAEIKLGNKLLLLLTTPLPIPPGGTAATAASSTSATAASSTAATLAAAPPAAAAAGASTCTQGVQQLGPAAAAGAAAAATAGGVGCCGTVAVGRGFDGSSGGDAGGGEDIDLWWRGSKKGRSQMKAPRLLVYAAANGQVRMGGGGGT